MKKRNLKEYRLSFVRTMALMAGLLLCLSLIWSVSADVQAASRKSYVAPQRKDPNNSFGTAKKVKFSTVYNESLSGTGEKDYYNFTIASSGRVELAVTTPMKWMDINLYDTNTSLLWMEYLQWESVPGTYVTTFDLAKGTYYLVLGEDGDIGSYSFKMTFQNAGETYAEDFSNNLMEGADALTLNKPFNGQLAINDEMDLYTFTLAASDTLYVTVTSKMRYVYMNLYNSAGSLIWEVNPEWNSSTKTMDFTRMTSLSAGKYYLRISRDGVHTGPYSIQVVTSFSPTPTPIPGTPTPTPTPVPPAKAGLLINKSTATLYAGDVEAKYSKTVLRTMLTGLSGTVKFKSANKNIVTVSSIGVITAKAKGTTKVTAYIKTGGKTYKKKCTVTVLEPSLILGQTSMTIHLGEDADFVVIPVPPAEVYYQSRNPGKVMVDEEGTVTGVGKGTTYVDVTANGALQSVKIKVVE